MPETEFKNAAWYYPDPMEKAKNIKDYVAFCEYLFSSYPSCVYRTLLWSMEEVSVEESSYRSCKR